MRAKFVCSCLLFMATATVAGAQTTRYAPEHCYRLVGVSEVAVSPGEESGPESAAARRGR